MNNAETLPSELRMAAPPTIPQARSYMFKQKSEYTQYELNRGTKIRINIPRLQRTYLSKDSYLRFRINLEVDSATNNAGVRLKGAPLYFDRVGALSLFDRLEVYDYLGGTLIEQVNNIPALMTCLYDLHTPVESYDTKLDATQGAAPSKVYASSSINNQIRFGTSNSGFTLLSYDWNNNDDADATNRLKTAFVSYEFSIPIPSFLGVFSDKFIPLHNGFSIDLFLNSKDQSFVYYGIGANDSAAPDTYGPTKVTSAWFTNVELCAQVMELGNDAENLVLSSNGSGPLVISSRFYRYFTDIIKGQNEPDQSSSVGFDLNLNVVSLRNVRFGFRPLKYQNSIAYPGYGHRIRNYLTSFNFQYGSSYLPELAGISTRSTVLPVSKNGYPFPYTYTGATISTDSDFYKMLGYTQAYAELLKTGTKNQWSDTTVPCSIGGPEYCVDIVTKDTDFSDNINDPPPTGSFGQVWCGKFLGGIDLRLSAKDVISGIDTNGLLVRLNMDFDKTNLTKMVNSVCDVFCEHDAFVQIIPGVATTVTF